MSSIFLKPWPETVHDKAGPWPATVHDNAGTHAHAATHLPRRSMTRQGRVLQQRQVRLVPPLALLSVTAATHRPTCHVFHAT